MLFRWDAEFDEPALREERTAKDTCSGGFSEGCVTHFGDALLVNPYDLDGVADAIRRAVEMPREEQAARMGRMHQTVREQNIYRWAGLLLAELSRIPEEAPGDAAGGSSAPSTRAGRGIVD